MIEQFHQIMQKIYKLISTLKLKYNCNIVFDTRLLRENDIFIGLKTKNKNGSLYYKDAIKKKASLIIIDLKINQQNLIYIKNTKIFVKNFCKFILDSYKGKIIAITGSVGKTTYKENIYHILKNNSFKTYRSFKNYNNIQGLQFSIMNMNIQTDYSVFELGINNSNEMGKLVKTLKPHYSLVTCIENTHIGNFRNFRHLIDNKLKIFNSNRLIAGFINYNYDPHYIKTQISSKIQLLNVENIKKSSLKTKKIYTIDFTENHKKYKIQSSRGNFYENIAIISFLFLAKIIRKFELNNFFYEESVIESRGRKVSALIGKKKVNFYDHSYNACPYSLNKQILIFNERKINQKVYILGSMKELGKKSKYYHMKIIQLVSDLSLKNIIFIGDEFYKLKIRNTNYKFFKNYKPVVKHLNKQINSIKNIFVMGSRYNQLDRVIKKYVR